jgi:hypothetical protein
MRTVFRRLFFFPQSIAHLAIMLAWMAASASQAFAQRDSKVAKVPSASETATSVTCAPGGPTRTQSMMSATASAGPSTIASTVPSRDCASRVEYGASFAAVQWDCKLRFF